jgi:hypothetical protein
MRSNDDEDNTMHGGLDDRWPDSGRCLQFPKLRKVWFWGNAVRSLVEGQPNPQAWLDVPTAGVHTVMFSMREDGMEFDKFILTMDAAYKTPAGAGPPASPFRSGKVLAPAKP